MNKPTRKSVRSRTLEIIETPVHPVRHKIKDAIKALSLANLCLGNAWYDLFFDNNHGYFHRFPICTVSLLGLIANTLLFAVVFWSAAQFLHRTSNRWAHFSGHIAVCVALVFPLDFVRLHVFHIWNLLSILEHPLTICLVVITVVVSLRWHQMAAQTAKRILWICFPLVGFIWVKTAWLLVETTVLASPSTASVVSPPMFTTAPPQRVVWIILDELDYRVAFANRPRGLSLPELDRFQQQSFAATNAYPPGSCTDISMPAFVTGLPVASVKPVSANELMLTLSNGQEVGWSSLPNVFSRARDAGVNTAVVSWHHPYQRVFGSSLNHADCYGNPLFEPAGATTLLATMQLQIRAMVALINVRQLYVDLYRSILESSKSVAADARYGLVLLHIPVPHPPAIYNPHTNQLTIWGKPKARGYLDNLVLADRTIGELRRAMEKSGVWTNTWVLISADHWWRASAALDGKTDHRVPFILKSSGSSTGTVYPNRFNTIITHDLLLAILRGNINGTQEIVSWIDRHKVNPPVDYENHPQGYNYD